MNNTIEFTPEAVKQYLVAAVQRWRKHKAEALLDDDDWCEAMCYVDAFQSGHTSLFGTLVPEENLNVME